MCQRQWTMRGSECCGDDEEREVALVLQAVFVLVLFVQWSWRMVLQWCWLLAVGRVVVVWQEAC